MKTLRLTTMQRITGALWGLIVAGVATTAMFALSGADIDLVNVVIVGLFVLGGWLVVSALASVRPRKAPSQPDAVVDSEPDVTQASVIDES
ncbi:hypothetical protein [Demequina sp.]|uniref:hypothetical protein n=1 Tax=Demequina sp. TaxID=2050685 RepID=UPI003D0A88EA